MKNKLTIAFLLLVLISCTQSQTKNPMYICKDCGSFDLGKMTFKENIDVLSSKTEIFKTALVNQNNEEKDADQLTKNDVVKLYKYNFENQQNEILGDKLLNYNNEFSFTGLSILTTPDKKMLAYKATDFFEGDAKKIDQFITYLQAQNKSLKMVQNKMEGDLTVYQWISDKQITQLVRSNKASKEEEMIDGKSVVKYNTYVKLNYYNEAFIKNSDQDIVKSDLDFAVYNDKHFQKK
ncbi:hypothetical protein NG800_018210 [Epilithonimonas ginsengisoli]|uniref:Lipoprotein n=1 Tax=Epilithonimonas ginsengisoli TaxID=1245592 RepID=A0ABU4JMH4_9FLAO|nr:MULTISPECIES: hypothetical protein [Chryseobacterium group]MBV6881824.1 hypothetical protein [Epilithonimonas sp. FP105]MDW8550867.1 hypothetical protein [Epilithonimonas ginsengisoli]